MVLGLRHVRGTAAGATDDEDPVDQRSTGSSCVRGETAAQIPPGPLPPLRDAAAGAPGTRIGGRTLGALRRGARG